MLNEIQINRMANVPNVVQLHEVYETDKELILIQDLAEGASLLEYLKKETFAELEAAFIIKTVVETLIQIHEKGIIHRDIKLENIVYNAKTRELRLIDFGLSTLKTNIELFKKCGTPGYVAPEILRNEDYDESVDYFSLGVVLYAM